MKKKMNIRIVVIALLMVFATMLFVAIACKNGINYIGLVVIAVIMSGIVVFLAKLLTEKS